MSISIKEFAKKAGVSPQAIYKRLTTDLQPFVRVENGRKCLDDAALQTFSDSTGFQPELKKLKEVESEQKDCGDNGLQTFSDSTGFQPELKEVEKQKGKSNQVEKLTTELKTSCQLVEKLKSDLKNAEIRIEALQNEKEAMQEHLSDLRKQVDALNNQVILFQDRLKEAHILAANTQQQTKFLTDGKPRHSILEKIFHWKREQ